MANMKWQSVLFITVVWSLSNARGAAPLPFDCRIAADLCQNDGLCKAADGVCECQGDFAGFDCSITSVDFATLGAGDCTKSCSNGDCYKETGSEKCYCQPGYYYDVDDCVEKVQHTDCSSTGMTFKIIPQGTPSGKIHIKGNLSSPACAHDFNTDISVTFADTTCGAAITSTAEGEYVLTVLIKYFENYISPSDMNIILTCKVATDGGTITVESPPGGLISQTPAPPEIRAEIKDAASGLLFSIEPETFNISDKVTLTFILNKGDFQDFHVKSINLTDGGDTTTVEVVTDGCVVKDATFVTDFKEMISNPKILLVTLEMMAIQIGLSTSLKAVAEIVVCAQPDCGGTNYTIPTECDSASHRLEFVDTPLRRRKREATEAEDSAETLIRRLTVTGQIATQAPKPPVLTTDCLLNMAFILPIVLLSLMLVITAFVALYFCLKVSSKKHWAEEQANFNQAYRE